ncbi:unnamed protein product [Euphydryas editha]|uniref:Uncharacterized protein n=1 Tax=Euphydryas editha TaxID=104508 RepID=A0AAU9UH91_EUPED|nr:unnamed protein product [Euphydryas editha]CAH2099108.1 unnamed protein product [Euphydryas editha]CAH2099109.1 unnamed protein product [Euphydryas editha]CAH2099110.1 unnamed protein product [Euphydryas editha]CAH2099111.1 unnamed protein product [Euphydryas editha]
MLKSTAWWCACAETVRSRRGSHSARSASAPAATRPLRGHRLNTRGVSHLEYVEVDGVVVRVRGDGALAARVPQREVRVGAGRHAPLARPQVEHARGQSPRIC